MLAAYDKMIDVTQVTALLRRVGETADAEQVRIVLDELADEQPPRLIRTTAIHVTDDGSSQLLSYFVLPTPIDSENP